MGQNYGNWSWISAPPLSHCADLPAALLPRKRKQAMSASLGTYAGCRVGQVTAPAHHLLDVVGLRSAGPTIHSMWWACAPLVPPDEFTNWPAVNENL